MTVYIKKPIPVEAYHLRREDKPDWYIAAVNRRVVKEVEDGVYVSTLEGKEYGVNGCYIIKGVRGELYPCDESIFEETYDKVE